MKSSFSAKGMNEFLNGIITKGMSLQDLPGPIKFKKADKWRSNAKHLFLYYMKDIGFGPTSYEP
jgi:hypothetical protein